MIYVLGKKKGRGGRKQVVTASEIVEGQRGIRRVRRQETKVQKVKATMKLGTEIAVGSAVRKVAGAQAGQQTQTALRRMWDPEFRQRSNLARKAAVTRTHNFNRSHAARRRRRIRGRFA